MIAKIFDYFKTTLAIISLLALAVIINNEIYTNIVCIIFNIMLTLGSIFIWVFNFKLKDFLNAEFPQLQKGYYSFKKLSKTTVERRSYVTIRVLEYVSSIIFVFLLWKLNAIFGLVIYATATVICRNALNNIEKFYKLCNEEPL